MGGLGSGRTRRHTCIDDCLTLDASWLRKWERGASYTLSWGKWKETNFAKRTESRHFAYAALSTGEQPPLHVAYHACVSVDGISQQERMHRHTITTTSTPCHYGGLRWWFIAPCCRRRVRVLYISLKGGDVERMTPQCRNCLDLHYASQMQSYIELHKTYEKDLLRNYGYTYARERYHALKHHYFEVTPEYAYRAKKSELDRTIHMVKLLTRMHRLICRTYLQSFLSLKSEQDRLLYLEQVEKNEGKDAPISRLLRSCLHVERSQHTQETRADLLASIEDDEEGDIAMWKGFAEDIEEELAMLKQAA